MSPRTGFVVLACDGAVAMRTYATLAQCHQNAGNRSPGPTNSQSFGQIGWIDQALVKIRPPQRTRAKLVPANRFQANSWLAIGRI
jgi:hypothetical protein